MAEYLAGMAVGSDQCAQDYREKDCSAFCCWLPWLRTYWLLVCLDQKYILAGLFRPDSFLLYDSDITNGVRLTAVRGFVASSEQRKLDVFASHQFQSIALVINVAPRIQGQPRAR